MDTWNDTPTIGGLLPAGPAVLTITDVELIPGGTDSLGQVDIPRLEMKLSDGRITGEQAILLSTWAADKRATWGKILKTQAVGLGFVPSDGALTMEQIAVELGQYVPTLVGRQVNANIDHKINTVAGVDYTDHRVNFAGLVGVPVNA